MTSPPYFGLRDYGVAGQIGLEAQPDCLGWATGDACGFCYVCTLRGVFREVWRVLKSDGVVWLNLGDSYGNSNTSGTERCGKHLAARQAIPTGRRRVYRGVKAKDLIMIPHRAALALQADGWWVRNDIVWSKPNGMPHPATDRVVNSHEYVFLLAKSRRYYFDHLAIRNPPSPSFVKQVHDGYDPSDRVKDYDGTGHHGGATLKARILARSTGRYGVGGVVDSDVGRRDKQRGHTGFNDRWNQMTVAEQRAHGSNARSVWHIASANYRGNHFAVMPRTLAARCILAGSRHGDVVFDPFGGSGTTAAEALRYGRIGLSMDLNQSYSRMYQERIASLPQLALLFR